MMKATLEKFGDVIAAGTLLGRIGAPEVCQMLSFRTYIKLQEFILTKACDLGYSWFMHLPQLQSWLLGHWCHYSFGRWCACQGQVVKVVRPCLWWAENSKQIVNSRADSFYLGCCLIIYSAVYSEFLAIFADEESHSWWKKSVKTIVFSYWKESRFLGVQASSRV